VVRGLHAGIPVVAPSAQLGKRRDSRWVDFVKVFDVVDAGFREWIFSLFGLMPIAVGVIILAFRRIIRAAGVPDLEFKGFLSWPSRAFPFAFIGFGILWAAVTFFPMYAEYQSHKELAQQNRCRVVEGPVQNFVPMPYGGHAQESFSVAGVPFRHSDFNITGGFNNTSSHGGPVSGDSYVRICSDPAGNVILRLEIRDFKGELRDYSKADIFPPTVPGDFQSIDRAPPPDDMPWYGSLAPLFFLLDFLVIRALYVPYLCTFFRLRTTTVRDVVIPASLIRGEKIKLRNNMIYWDASTGAIWLRPRGMNLFRAPFMAGRLNTDAGGKSITGTEILFSSGFPFVMAWLLWSIYQASPPRDPEAEPVLVVGIFAVYMLVAGFIILRDLRSRMAQLIEDAVSEIKSM
jgi:hypothetical protein